MVSASSGQTIHDASTRNRRPHLKLPRPSYFEKMHRVLFFMLLSERPYLSATGAGVLGDLQVIHLAQNSALSSELQSQKWEQSHLTFQHGGTLNTEPSATSRIIASHQLCGLESCQSL